MGTLDIRPSGGHVALAPLHIAARIQGPAELETAAQLLQNGDGRVEHPASFRPQFLLG